MIWVLALAGSVSVIGLTSDILQAPPSFRKWWAIAVNLNTYGFVFVTWLLLGFIGYWMLMKEDQITLESNITKAYYKIFMYTMISGGIGIQILPTIRFWYWDGYYIDFAEEQEKKAAELAEQEGLSDTDIIDGDSGFSNGGSTSGGFDSGSGSGSNSDPFGPSGGSGSNSGTGGNIVVDFRSEA